MAIEQYLTYEFSSSVNRRLDLLRPEIEAILALPNRVAAENTIIQYRKACFRLQARNERPEEIAKESRRSYNLYRAALVYFAVKDLSDSVKKLTDHSNPPSNKAAHKLVTRIEFTLTILRDYPPDARRDKSRWRKPPGRQVRKSKRIGLHKLPDAWRLPFIDAFTDDPEYVDAVRVTALTGCRPEELRKGVEVEISLRQTLIIRIHGAKVTDNTGQKLRTLDIGINNSIAQDLALSVHDNGRDGQMLVNINNPRKFCDRLRTISRRVFPEIKYIVSPYTLRHSVSADLKAQGLSVESRAQFMGHQSGLSQRAYGRARQCKGPFISVLKVSATKTVRHIEMATWPEKPSPASAAMHPQSP